MQVAIVKGEHRFYWV